MSGFVFFAIIIFVVIPIIKNIAGGTPAKKPASRTRSSSGSNSGSGQKNWTQVQKLLQEQMRAQNKNTNFGKKDKHGHSGARRNTHNRMHSGDGDTRVFTESHQARVKKRDTRDRSERNRIEAMLHSKKNRSIVREGNKSIDGWGKRGDGASVGGLLFLLLFGLIGILVLSKVAPDLWLEIMRVINN